MNNSDYISLAALSISGLSLYLSFHFGLRDRVCLKIKTKYYPYNPNYDQAHINIKLVNAGRRPTIIKLFGGDLANGSWNAAYLGEKSRGIRLGEHDMYETNFYEKDIHIIGPDFESDFVTLWFEDTLGQRHRIKEARKLIEKLKSK